MSNLSNIISQLISFESVTPMGLECLEYIKSFTEKLGFEVEIVKYGPVHNLFAKFKSKNPGPHICFGGHVDVVPPGDLNQWNQNPNQLVEENGIVSGLGIVDMKGAIGCFLHALEKNINHINGTVSILLTTDEEGDATDGLKKYMESEIIQKEKFDLFILGEPTCNKLAGDSIKVGRRGSVTGNIQITGKKGHVGYPEFANSAVRPLRDILDFLDNKVIGEGNQYFEPTTTQITGLNIKEQVENVIPGNLEINFSCRFNSNYIGEEIIKIISTQIQKISEKHNVKQSITFKKHGEPFVIKNDKIIEWLEKYTMEITNKPIDFNTKGATSDGRFLTKLAPVVEIGLEESEAHKINEKSTLENLITLEKIYQNLLINMNKLDI